MDGAKRRLYGVAVTASVTVTETYEGARGCGGVGLLHVGAGLV